MARNHYTAEFPAASPGDEVTWASSARVYLDANSQQVVAAAYLNESRQVSLYTDASSLAVTCGEETLTLTTGSPSQSGADPAASGGSSAVPVHKTSAYNAAASDAVLADASGGNFTVTLPAPVAGNWVIVKNIGGTGVVTVAHHASENVDGASSVVIASQYVAKTFLSDGTDWWVV